MRHLIAVALALILLSCRSTRNAVKIEASADIEQQVEVIEKLQRAKTEVEARDIVKITEESVEIVEEPTPKEELKRTERRTKRTLEVDRSTFERLIEDRSMVDSTARIVEVIDAEANVDQEVEDSTPRNLRWLGILGISASVIAICIVILKLKK